MRDVGGGEELLDHAADGGGVDAHATLFLNDVALLVELALDGLADALAFEIGPELETVGGHAPEVLGGVFGGRGVDADGAVLLGDVGELIGDDELLRFGLGVLEGFLEAGELCGVLADALAEFGVVGGVGDFDLREGDLFGGIVGGADLLGALEGHVLEHVGEAAVALGIVGRAGVDQRVEAEDGSLGTLADDQREAVRQDLYRCSLLKTREILCLGTAQDASESQGYSE